MTRRKVTNEGPDYYPTPEWATAALLSVERFEGDVREPCCGEGHISKVLERAGLTVQSTDLHEYGFAEGGVDVRALKPKCCSNLITNPPYNLATEIFATLFSASRRKTALLLRLSFLESVRRYPIFTIAPPSRVWVFSERLSLSPAGVEVNGGGTVSYAWFIWDHADESGRTCLDWIPPGFKNRHK